jgi:hypothetical protein
MTDHDYVHYIMIVDRSGSMQSIRDDTEGGLRAFVDRQLKGVNGDKRTVSFYQFDNIHDTVYDFDLLEKVKNYTLVPRNSTALLDACGFAITEVGEKLAAMTEDRRPGYVMVVIATDGMENSSHEYTRKQIREMIEHQQERYNWKFTYIGANQDSFTEARGMGIPLAATLNYYPSSTGTSSSWSSAANAVSAGTVTTYASVVYNSDQRREAMKES